MRWCVLWLLLSALLGAQSAPDSAGETSSRTAHVEGQVLSQTGEPLRKAILRLTPYDSTTENAVAYSDTSDSAGNFAI